MMDPESITKDDSMEPVPDKGCRKIRVTQKAKLGKKQLSCHMEFETDTVPEMGTAEMYTAIFKSAKGFGAASLTAEDERKTEEEMRRFWGRSVPATPSRSRKRLKTLNGQQLKGDRKRSRNNDKRPSQQSQEQSYDDVQELLNEITFLGQSPSKKDNTRSQESSTTEPILLDSSDSEEAETLPNDSQSDYDAEGVAPYSGEMLMFHALYMNKRYPIRIYEGQLVEDLRQLMAQKAGLQEVENIELYFDYLKLEDDRTVQYYGVQCGSEIDAYFTKKTDKELYESGSKLILRFKLRTADRRGREDCFVYINKNTKMQEVRDQFAKERNIEPNRVKLMFDGDNLNLSSTPEECYLEPDDCLDVVVDS